MPTPSTHRLCLRPPGTSSQVVSIPRWPYGQWDLPCCTRVSQLGTPSLYLFSWKWLVMNCDVTWRNRLTVQRYRLPPLFLLCSHYPSFEARSCWGWSCFRLHWCSRRGAQGSGRGRGWGAECRVEKRSWSFAHGAEPKGWGGTCCCCLIRLFRSFPAPLPRDKDRQV